MVARRWIGVVSMGLLCWALTGRALSQVPSGQVSYWPLDDGSGTTARDMAGTNNGTLVNGPTWVTTGRFGGALSFNGTAQAYVNIPPGFVLGQAGSVSMWVQTSTNYQTLGHHGHIFWACQTNDGDGYGDQIEMHVTMRGGDAANNGQVNFNAEVGATDITITSPNPYNNGQWHHIVATWDRAANCVLYMDGAQVAQASYATAPNVNYSGSVRLGAPAGTGYTRYYAGLLDEVRYFNRALTAADVTALFNLVPGQTNGTVARSLPTTGFSGATPVPVILTATPNLGGAMTVREGIPTGWGTPVITPPSNGTANFAGSTITWNLTLAPSTPATLNYTVTPPTVCDPKTYTWVGRYDAGATYQNLAVGGNTVMNRASDGWQNALLTWTNSEWISDETPVGHVDYFACDDSYTFYGAGHDIWDAADDFQFLYANVTGNFQIQAVVDLQTVPNVWTKAGLMARASNAQGSPFVDMVVSGTGPTAPTGQTFTGNRRLAFQWRDTLGGACAGPANNAGYADNNNLVTLRLERTTASGNGIIGGYDNGEGVVNWAFGTQVAPNIPTATPIIVGLCLTSHQTGTEARAVFTNITRTGGFPPPATPPTAPSNLTAVQIVARVQLAWTDNSTNETGFKIERKTGVGGTYAEIAVGAANSPSYLDSNVVAGTTYYYRVRATNLAGDSAYSNEANIAVTQALEARRWVLYEK
jgi:hypothetical protein